jgi:AraC-like DNA-binding protein
MDRKLLEDRRHGSPDFPVGFYRVAKEAGEPVVLDSHWHAEAEFLTVESGKGVFQIGLAVYEVHAGESLYISGEDLHGGYPLDGSACTFSAVVFDLDWLASGQDLVASRYLRPLQRGEWALPVLWRRSEPRLEAARSRLAGITEIGLRADDHPAKELLVKGGLLLLFADLFASGLAERRAPWETPGAVTPERLKQVLSHIERHYARKLTVKELADVAGISEGHFSRMFKAYLRRTPIEYLNRYRLRHAAERLRQPGVSIAEAAMESGFDNFSYFSKMFAAEFGCTPSEYRKRSRGK